MRCFSWAGERALILCRDAAGCSSGASSGWSLPSISLNTMNGSCARLPLHGNGRDKGIRPRIGKSRTINDE